MVEKDKYFLAVSEVIRDEFLSKLVARLQVLKRAVGGAIVFEDSVHYGQEVPFADSEYTRNICKDVVYGMRSEVANEWFNGLDAQKYVELVELAYSKAGVYDDKHLVDYELVWKEDHVEIDAK